MPWRCCVPGCKPGYDEAKSMGVVFHGLPTRDPQRCRTWLRAIQSPRFTEDTPASRYSGVRVCSLHFKPEDYEEDFRARILNTAPRPTLKSGAVPSVFPGRAPGEPGGTDTGTDTGPTAPKRRRSQACGPAGTSSPSPPAPAAQTDESFCIVVSVDPLDQRDQLDQRVHSLHSEPDLSSTSEESDEDGDSSVVSTRSLMELFRRCQTCGQPISQTQVLHAGVQMRVKWSCHGGHSGTWKSSPHLRDLP